jgi:hypothetical protein
MTAREILIERMVEHALALSTLRETPGAWVAESESGTATGATKSEATALLRVVLRSSFDRALRRLRAGGVDVIALLFPEGDER